MGRGSSINKIFVGVVSEIRGEGSAIWLSFNLNEPFLLTHPPTWILTLFGFRNPYTKMDHPLLSSRLAIYWGSSKFAIYSWEIWPLHYYTCMLDIKEWNGQLSLVPGYRTGMYRVINKIMGNTHTIYEEVCLVSKLPQFIHLILKNLFFTLLDI